MRRLLLAGLSILATVLLLSLAVSAKIPWMGRGIHGPVPAITLGPTSLSSSVFNAVAGDANTTVGSLSTTGSEGPVYSLVTTCGANCADSSKFAIAGTSLNVGASDVVCSPSCPVTYHITVRETDSGAGPFSNNPFDQALTVTGNSVSITAITMNCGGTCTFTFTAGTVQAIGTATATLSGGGSLTGSPWSLAYSGTDHAGTTCHNYGSDFTINPTTGVVTSSASAPVGSFPGVCVQAAQPGFAAPTITVTPAAPSILTTTALGSTVATYTASMPDSTAFVGNSQFGAPNLDDGGIFALGSSTITGGVLNGSIIVNPSGPGVGTAGVDNITLQANQPLPFVQAFTFTGTTGGIAAALGPPFNGVVPTPAQNVGFTTLIANYDWSNTNSFTFNGNSYNWQTLSGYIDCKGAGSPLWWNLSYSGGTVAPCARYSIVSDANFGSNVLDILYTPADFDSGERATDLETQSTTAPGPCSLGPPISCTGSGAPGSWFPSQFYIEVAQSLNQNGSYGTGTCGTPVSVIGGVFSFSSPAGPLETDQSELYNNGNQCTNGGNTIDHSTGGSGTFLSPSPQIGAGVDPSQAITYGALQTANASTNVWTRINYVDAGVPSTAARTQIGTNTATLSTGVLTTRTEWKLPLGPEQFCGSCRPSGNLDWRIKYIRIWGCAGWATGHC